MIRGTIACRISKSNAELFTRSFTGVGRRRKPSSALPALSRSSRAPPTLRRSQNRLHRTQSQVDRISPDGSIVARSGPGISNGMGSGAARVAPCRRDRTHRRLPRAVSPPERRSPWRVVRMRHSASGGGSKKHWTWRTLSPRRSGAWRTVPYGRSPQVRRKAEQRELWSGRQ